jgi:carbon monoxide dehydrogenase subunit G
MKLEHDFRVDAAPDVAWPILLDLERIAPCMPGAQLQEVEGDEYRGTVKVKVGPITAQYKGAARIVDSDAAAHRVVIHAEGRDTRGQGNASATITANLTGAGDGSQVHVDTDLNVTGKVAQFGRGVMADVSTKLLGQFVDCLGTTILGRDETPAPPSDPGPGLDDGIGVAEAMTGVPVHGSHVPADGPRRIDAPEPEAVDLVRAAGGAVAKRLVPLAVGAVVIVGLVIWLVSR